MAPTVTIRGLDESTQLALKHRAVDNRRSFEAEIRAILTDAAKQPVGTNSAPQSALFAASAEFRQEVADLDFSWPKRVVDAPRQVFA